MPTMPMKLLNINPLPVFFYFLLLNSFSLIERNGIELRAVLQISLKSSIHSCFVQNNFVVSQIIYPGILDAENYLV